MAGGKTLKPPEQGEALDETLGHRGRVLIFNRDLLLYVGLQGEPTTRSLGAVTLYFALDEPLSLTVGAASPRPCNVALVPPYVSHRVAAKGDLYAVLLIEPECLDLATLEQVLDHAALENIGSRIRAYISGIGDPERDEDAASEGLDSLLADVRLPRRQLDPRIWRVVDSIRRHPDENTSAAESARTVALSTSRFIHLFNEELGVAFRAFRAWKRARSFFNHVMRRSNLTQLALDMGYPDASYFSHTIRRVYGLKPKDIYVGSRHLHLFGEEPAVEEAVERIGRRSA